jgi:hypothetical protein
MPVIMRINCNVARAPSKPIQVARYALMAIFQPILLAALAFAVMASSVPISASALSDVLAAGAGPGRVTAGDRYASVLVALYSYLRGLAQYP